MEIKFGILTISDRSAIGDRTDESGPALAEAIQIHGWAVAKKAIVPDEVEVIKETLILWTDSNMVDVILTTGGTGVSPRDVTPEATLAIIEKQAPGIPEAMRAESLKITPHAMLTRMVAGIRRKVLIINLPGSPKGAVENYHVIEPVLEHAVKLLRESPDSEQGHLVTK